MATRSLPVVLFAVKYTPDDSDLTEEEAMRQVFGFTGPVSLRDRSNTQYFAGNYRQRKKFWAGEFGSQRQALPLSIDKNRNEGYVFSVSEQAIIASESSSAFAYDPIEHRIAYWERAQLPYTRLQSYVDTATRKSQRRFRVELQPVKEERTISSWLNYFDAVSRLSVTYRHSQSPGNRLVDAWIEAANAQEITETVKAPKGDTLNVERLLKSTPIGEVVSHIDVNSENGRAHIQGEVGGESLTVNTRDEIERKKIDAEPKSFAVIPALIVLLNVLSGRR